MNKILKNKKFLLGFIIGAFIFGTTGVLAVTYYASKDVTYDNTESGMTSENVQDAIDELYQVATSEPITVNGKEILVVTSGDGLYKDSYEENVYTYRGANPNNYVTFNGETWRIVSANTSDNTIKIIRSSVLEERAYDTSSNGRYDGKYCNDSSDGCNIYGSTSSLYNTSGNVISTLAYRVNGTKYQLPSKESEMSTYLNGTYYNSLNATARSMIINGEYKAAPVSSNSISNISTQIGYASEAIWKGKVGLLDATEYMRATTGSRVSSDNWLHISDLYWTMSPYSFNFSDHVWFVSGLGNLNFSYARNSYGVRPVVTLSPDIQITGGNGSSSQPYQLAL